MIQEGNTIKYEISSVEYSMTIPEGQYNANTFITAFQTQFAAGGHGKTCVMTLDKIPGKFLLSPSDSTFTIKIYTDAPLLSAS